MKDPEKIYKVGDKVWFVFGYRYEDLLAVRCSILEVDDNLRKQYYDSIIFYWIDEPIGYGIPISELFDSIVDAKRAIKRKIYNWKDPIEVNGSKILTKTQFITLDKLRKTGKKYLQGDSVEEPIWPEGFCPPKTFGEDWFNAEMLDGQ